MNVDLEALKAAALAAVPGPYTLVPRLNRVDVVHSDQAPGAPSGVVASVTVRATWFDQQTATARMIGALHPAAVLALIERLERAEAELQRQRDDSARQAALDLSAYMAGDRPFREMSEDAMHARMWRVIRALPMQVLHEIWSHVPVDRMDDAMFIAARETALGRYHEYAEAVAEGRKP